MYFYWTATYNVFLLKVEQISRAGNSFSLHGDVPNAIHWDILLTELFYPGIFWCKNGIRNSATEISTFASENIKVLITVHSILQKICKNNNIQIINFLMMTVVAV